MRLSTPRRFARFFTVTCMVCLCSAQALALDPTLDVTQYAHTAWRTRDGFFSKGFATTFTQTPDGYLWIGTGFGLLRFDGVRKVAWQPPSGQSLPDQRVRL